MTRLIITSCTGEKVVESDRQLTREDFAKGAAHVAEREKELKDSLRTAGEIYSGEQHVRLMRGVSAMRSALEAGPSPIDLHILSAGYGLIPEGRVVAPYEITFATMKSKELRDWADSLQAPEDFRKTVAKPYEFGLILLGDNYLTACALDSSVKFGGPTLLLCGTGMAKKLPILANVRVVPVSNPEAKRFSCGLIGLKGELAARALAGVKADASAVSKILDPKFDVLGWLDSIKIHTSCIKSLKETSEETLNILNLAVEVAAKKHCQMGVPMVVWKNGKILEFLPQRKKSIESTDRFFKV